MAWLLAAAAAGAAQIEGFVTDKASGSYLEGAVVKIPKLDKQTSTNRRGYFEIDGVDPGLYAVEVTYVGAQTKVVEAEVGSDEASFLEVGMDLNVYELTDFTVSSYQSATTRALNMQRSSENLKNIVASDQFGQFADTNAAEALNRLPGVSVERDQGEGRFVVIRGINPNLNSIAIDGVALAAPSADERSALLDTIPIEVLDTLEVTKAVLPNQPGDSIGGHINLRTPSAFDYEGTSGSLSASGLYSDLVDEWGHKINGSFGTTFGTEDQFGLHLTFVNSERTFGSDNVESDEWVPVGNGFVPDDTIEYREYDLTRERTGVSANFEFQQSRNSLFFLRGSWNEYKDTEVRDLAAVSFEGAFANVTPSSFGHVSESDEEEPGEWVYPGIAPAIEVKEREENMRIFAASFGGEHRFDQWEFDYTLSLSRAEEETPFDYEAVYIIEGAETAAEDPAFVGLGGGPIVVGTNGYHPRLRAPGSIAGYTGPDYGDASQYTLDELTLGEQMVEETDLGAQANIKREFDFERLRYVKFGGLVRDKNKTSEFDEVEVDDDFGIETAASYPGTSQRNFLNRPMPSLSTDIFDYAEGNLPFAENEFDFIEDYESDEQVLAAYLMASFEVSDWGIIAGARIEHTDFETEGWNYVDDKDGDNEFATKVNFNKDYTNVLPGIHLKREVGDNGVFRASWNHTIARPTFEQSRPGIEIEQEGGDVAITQGNPDLDPYEAMNLDASFQYYSEAYGVFGVSVFYKEIENFIYEQTFDSASNEETTTFENGDSGDILGLELSYSKQLSFLPGALSGLSVSGNLTFTDSSADAQRPGGGEMASTTFLKQSDLIGNVSLAWEYDRYFLRFSGTYRDDYLDEIGEESFQDRYVDDFFQVDFYGSARVYKELTLFVEVNNIFNEPFRAYWGDSGRLSQFEEYGVSGSIGAKWQF